jgi:membrane-associated protein
VAGIGRMTYKKFILFSVLGAGLWIFSFIPLGYYFGNLPAVKHNFKIVMLFIIFISIAPALIELYQARFGKKS